MNAPSDAALAAGIRDLALAAGAEIMRVYDSNFAVETKDDRSPVTEADRKGEAIILAGLAELTPEIPVVAEEAVAAGQIPDVSGGTFWLVDPLDGTREFIGRNGDFTVNIALIRARAPALGVVFAPAKGRLYNGIVGAGASLEVAGGAATAIRARACAEDGAVVVVSRSHRSPETDDWLAEIKVKSLADAGSSLKFCLLAEGSADLYPRLGRTMEWDVAAGHAVLAAAGGSVARLDGGRFDYAKPGFENPHFVARGA